MTKPKFLPLVTYREYLVEEMRQRAAAFCADRDLVAAVVKIEGGLFHEP